MHEIQIKYTNTNSNIPSAFKFKAIIAKVNCLAWNFSQKQTNSEGQGIISEVKFMVLMKLEFSKVHEHQNNTSTNFMPKLSLVFQREIFILSIGKTVIF